MSSPLSSVILISTAEFTLKSHPVRHQLVRLLKRHIRFDLKRIGLENCEIKLAGGFLVVHKVKDAESVAKDLARILGVAHADACERVSSDLDEILQCAATLAERTIKHGETFAVRAHNFEPSHLNSKEIEIRAGAEILSRLPSGAKVSLGNPDHVFRVFFGGKEAYILGRRFNGPGGLPVGSQGKLLGLATDPAYSPLSFYLLMKRGAMISPVIPNIRPLLGETQPEVILEGLRMLRPFVPKKTFQAHLIEIDESASKILDSVDQQLQRVFSIRLVFRAIAHLAQAGRALGLVTGDSFGRNGLETFKELRVVDEVASFPVYRPLLALDEDSVNQQLGQLGLLHLATNRRARQVTTTGLSDDSITSLRVLEQCVQAQELAQRIAANSVRILV